MNSSLIDRYIAEMGKHLPLKNRADIQKETRSTLEDMLEERSRASGREGAEAMVVDLLKEYGKPEIAAASFLPERSLVGPQMYPIFSLVTRIALLVLGIVLLVTLSIGSFSPAQTPIEVLTTIGAILLKVASALVSAFGSIVITFAILERIPGIRKEFQQEKEDDGKSWDPRSLPEVEEVEKFSIAGLTAEIVFTGIALLFFNFFPQWVGFGFLENNKWTFLSLLSDAFFRYLPYINILWLAHIALNLVLLGQGRWQAFTRWLRIALQALGIVLAVVMLAGPDLVVSNVDALHAADPNLSAEAARLLTIIPRILAKALLGLTILGGGVEFIKSLLPMLTGKK